MQRKHWRYVDLDGSIGRRLTAHDSRIGLCHSHWFQRLALIGLEQLLTMHVLEPRNLYTRARLDAQLVCLLPFSRRRALGMPSGDHV